MGDLEKDAELSELDVAMFSRAPVEAMQSTLAYIRCASSLAAAASCAQIWSLKAPRNLAVGLRKLALQALKLQLRLLLNGSCRLSSLVP